MADFIVSGVKIVGVGACVPSQVSCNLSLPLLGENSHKFIDTTGIKYRRVSDKNICSSDLCFEATIRLLDGLKWERESIDCLIFVSQTHDYVLPATSCILQKRLGLSSSCYALDITLGCSGWVYGLSVISSLLSAGGIKRGLLLAGDTISKICSSKDQSTYPLFGDAGTVTALEFTGDIKNKFYFSMNTDGEGKDAIIVPHGGCRHPINTNSFIEEQGENGISYNQTQLHLDGMDVFSFGIKRAPESVDHLLNVFNIEKDNVDYFLFHQANLFMNNKIAKRIKIQSDVINKVPSSLEYFGNTSCASIPLTMVTKLKSDLENRHLNMIACGFGVGLSWGSVYFQTANIVCNDLTEL